MGVGVGVGGRDKAERNYMYERIFYFLYFNIQGQKNWVKSTTQTFHMNAIRLSDRS